jgi:hypothetical protein
MDFEGSRLGKSFGDIFAGRLLIGIEVEIVARHINLVNEFIVVRESQAFAAVNGHFAGMKFATFLYNGVGAVGAKCRTTNQKEQKHQLLHLVVARVWSPLVFFAKGQLGATDRRRAGRL